MSVRADLLTILLPDNVSHVLNPYQTVSPALILHTVTHVAQDTLLPVVVQTTELANCAK